MSANDVAKWLDATAFLPRAADTRLTGPRLGDPAHERDVARRFRGVPCPVRPLDSWSGTASMLVWGYAQRCIARVDYASALDSWENDGGR